MIAASLISYIASQNLDVSIFHRLKARHGESKLWLRNNLSTMTSQLIDTVLFITVAFWGIVPFSVLAGMVVTQYLVKLGIALIDTPIVYLLVKTQVGKDDCRTPPRRESQPNKTPGISIVPGGFLPFSAVFDIRRATLF